MPIILSASPSELLNTFLPCHTFHRGEQAYDETMDLAVEVDIKQRNNSFVRKKVNTSFQ